jgi:uncharacterized protein (DUF2147 family)
MMFSRIAIGSLVFTLLCLSAFFVNATELTPVGLWKTVDDDTGQAKGLIRIRETNGRYEGSVEKVFPKPGQNPVPKCAKCDGSRRNQPVLGMMILWGFTKRGNDYEGGEILDPEDGKIYHAKLKVIEDGNKLEVRGYISIPLFGRSKIWLREE